MNHKAYLICIAVCGVAAIFTWSFVRALEQRSLIVNFFDIGQGDAALIEASGNFQILIDGGPDNSVLNSLGAAMPRYDKTIELVVISHPDKDHVAGLVEVLRRYSVSRVLATFAAHDLSEYEEIKRLIAEKEIPVTIARSPMRVSWASGHMDVLYPFEISQREAAEISSNARSIVNRLVFGKTSVLFTGDIEAAQETELVFRGVALDADILKVAHHGSKSSSTGRFLDAVDPAYAIISAGRENRYQHPHTEVVSRLEERGIAIMRTDTTGDIVFESDGQEWFVEK